MKKQPQKLRISNKKKIGIIAAVLIIAAGLCWTIIVYAGSLYVSGEAQSGTLGGSATVQSNAGAIGGQYVQFGAPPSGQSCTDPSFTTSSQEGGQAFGNYYVFNNMWNVPDPPSSGAGSQTLYACNYNNWYVIADMPPAGQPSNDVKTYPDVQENFSSVPVSGFSTLTSSFSEIDTCNSGDDYEDAYDMWLNGVASDGSNEVMIWNRNCGQTPAGSDQGSVTFNGITYTVYATSGDSYVAFVANSTFTSGTVNLLAFYDWLITNNFIASDSVVDQIDYGVEVCSTNNAPETFTFNNFSITDDH
jgi:hypothetical protein